MGYRFTVETGSRTQMRFAPHRVIGRTPALPEPLAVLQHTLKAQSPQIAASSAQRQLGRQQSSQGTATARLS